MNKKAIFWFRRDLRLNDNNGLFQALSSGLKVIPIFIFDRNILDELEDRDDPRVNFIHNELMSLSAKLRETGSDLKIYYGYPLEIWEDILKNEHNIEAVYLNRDYEPYAEQRDHEVKSLLDKKGINLFAFKDHVIFEKSEIVKDDGNPYTVFTPYKRKWLKRLESETDAKGVSMFLKAHPSEHLLGNFTGIPPQDHISLRAMGFEQSKISIPLKQVSQKIIKMYHEKRNFPAQDGTSRLGIHFRFGTISIREKAKKSIGLSSTFLNELIWRDFYSMILANFPFVVSRSFREKYDRIEWRNDEKEFELWCKGKTGYPIVDAGMRELNQSGYMHNRVRMITASFLTKHLLIDWRWGEAYFARRLLDFDLASNNGGWQWAAGSGTDAAPYFRIFNPTAQQQKFDKHYRYIKKWVPEFGTPEYPQPIVDHKFARERCLATYRAALSTD